MSCVLISAKIDDFSSLSSDFVFKEFFNSTCLPSGNLVDGLPLDLHTDARGYCLVLGPALFCGGACKNVVLDKQCCCEQ